MSEVVIAGGAKGLGKALTELFAHDGSSVLLLDKEAPELLSSSGVEYRFCDLCQEENISLIAQEVSPTILIHCVGLYTPLSLHETSLSQWQEVIKVNLTSAFLFARAFLPRLKEGGVSVFISTTLGSVPEPQALAYSVAKAGLEMFVKAVALEYAPQRKRVFAVAPGPIEAAPDTEWCAATALEYERGKKIHPQERFLSAMEVAQAIKALTTPTFSSLTGSIIPLDGGEGAVGISWSEATKIVKKCAYLEEQ